MKSVCFYFKIHQPFRLKRYRFFDIGNDHYYYDDFANDEIMTRLAETSYFPMAETLLQMINDSNREFKCALSISGTAIEQFQLYTPEFIDLLKKLADTGCVEFLSGTYSHSLSSLEDPEEFMREVKDHDNLIYRLFGVKPKVFANTELIYDDDIATLIASMGFKTVLTEGAKHVLGWKSPNYIYSAATAPDLRLLLTNDKLADDVSRNFNNTAWDEYPLTADKYIDWLASLPEEEQVVNLYMSMETFGSFLPKDTGIFDFMKALPRFGKEKGIQFTTPSDVVAKLKAVGEISVPFPISDIDEARDVSAWKGNELQREALGKLYAVAERVSLCTDRRLKQDWEYLQSSDHFYYMSTKNMADGASHAAFSPYDSPFAAFTNYMNVLADFLVRVEEQYPENIEKVRRVLQDAKDNNKKIGLAEVSEITGIGKDAIKHYLKEPGLNSLWYWVKLREHTHYSNIETQEQKDEIEEHLAGAAEQKRAVAISEITDATGLSYSVISTRIKADETLSSLLEDSLAVRDKNYKLEVREIKKVLKEAKDAGLKVSVAYISKKTGISRNIITSRIDQNRSLSRLYDSVKPLDRTSYTKEEIESQNAQIKAVLEDAILNGQKMTSLELGAKIDNIKDGSVLTRIKHTPHLLALWKQVKIEEYAHDSTNDIDAKMKKVEDILMEAFQNDEKLTSSKLVEKTGISKGTLFSRIGKSEILSALWAVTSANPNGHYTDEEIEVQSIVIERVLRQCLKENIKPTLNQLHNYLDLKSTTIECRINENPLLSKLFFGEQKTEN